MGSEIRCRMGRIWWISNLTQERESHWRSSRTRSEPSTDSRRKSLHLRIKVGLALEADARQLGHGDVAVLDAHAIREAAVGLEEIGIALIAAETEAGGDVEGHLVPAVWDAAARRPAVRVQYLQRPHVFAEAVGERAIEL